MTGGSAALFAVAAERRQMTPDRTARPAIRLKTGWFMLQATLNAGRLKHVDAKATCGIGRARAVDRVRSQSAHAAKRWRSRIPRQLRKACSGSKQGIIAR